MIDFRNGTMWGSRKLYILFCIMAGISCWPMALVILWLAAREEDRMRQERGWIIRSTGLTPEQIAAGCYYGDGGCRQAAPPFERVSEVKSPMTTDRDLINRAFHGNYELERLERDLGIDGSGNAPGDVYGIERGDDADRRKRR